MSDEYEVRIAKAAAPALVSTLHLGKADAPTAAAAAVSTLTTNPRNRPLFADAVDHLVQLCWHGEGWDSKAHAAAALANLAKAPDLRQAIFDAGAIPPLHGLAEMATEDCRESAANCLRLSLIHI